jgi:hypothetical protein
MEKYQKEAEWFRIATAEFPERYAEYERQLAKWQEYQLLGGFSKFVFRLTEAFFLQKPMAPSPPPPLGEPPVEPTHDEWYRYSDLKVVFDGNPAANLDSSLVDLPNDYPPDWESRAERCRERDGNQCRICGPIRSPNSPLNVHHVVPIPAEGNHSLQNLLTVCVNCHKKCHEYIRHATPIALKYIWPPR